MDQSRSRLQPVYGAWIHGLHRERVGQTADATYNGAEISTIHTWPDVIETYATLAGYLKGIPASKWSICGRCEHCGIWFSALERDHIIPKFAGGDDSDGNVQIICASCHHIKTIGERKLWRNPKRGSSWSKAARLHVSTLRKGKPGRKKSEEECRKISKAMMGNKNGIKLRVDPPIVHQP